MSLSSFLLLLMVVGAGCQHHQTDDSCTAIPQPKEVCYRDLGCFAMDDPWFTKERVIPPPAAPESIQTNFYLFTRKCNERRSFVLLYPKISSIGADFNPSRPIIFITHGLGSNTSAEWMPDMKNAFLEKMDANVFLTDWGPGAGEFLLYNQAVANTRVVAAEMLRFIKHLISEYQVKPENIHLVGHSLGAQVSSYIGKEIRNISRITALDPAQPAFEGHDQRVRLDRSDATFVEVVHTDAKPTVPLFGLGMIRPHGHVDYYINGGFAQPGCTMPKPTPKINTLLKFFQLQMSVISNLAYCAHTRAIEVYIESLRFPNCTFWGHPGQFIETFLESVTAGYSHEYLPPAFQKCEPHSCSPLNLDNIKYPARGGFVVPSDTSPPYCIDEPEVDDIMGTLEPLLDEWRNYTHDYTTSIRSSITRRIESVGRIVGRAVGSIVDRVRGLSWILR